jgi:hypothetical protein
MVLVHPETFRPGWNVSGGSNARTRHARGVDRAWAHMGVERGRVRWRHQNEAQHPPAT